MAPADDPHALLRVPDPRRGDPVNFFPLRQEIEAVEEDGTVHRFTGEAVALCPTPSWVNAQACDSVTRWTDATGRVAHASYQELWFDDFRHLMRRRAAATATT